MASCASEKKFSFSYSHPLSHKKPINFALLKSTLRHPLLLCHIFSPATCSGEILLRKRNGREKKNWETWQYLILKDFCISTFSLIIKNGKYLLILNCNGIYNFFCKGNAGLKLRRILHTDSNILISIIDYNRELKWIWVFLWLHPFSNSSFCHLQRHAIPLTFWIIFWFKINVARPSRSILKHFKASRIIQFLCSEPCSTAFQLSRWYLNIS